MSMKDRATLGNGSEDMIRPRADRQRIQALNYAAIDVCLLGHK